MEGNSKMPIATFIMFAIFLVIMYYAFIKEKPKKEMTIKVESKVEDYLEKVALADKLNAINEDKLKEAEEKLNKLKGEK
jgi:F0F1-type ATP synthase membrane subunit b/b'